MQAAQVQSDGSSPFQFVPISCGYKPAPAAQARQMNQQQGRALEMLAHAVEYLQDDAAIRFPQCDHATRHDRVEAIDTLKAASRGLWFSLPVRETVWRRWFNRTPVITFPV